MPRSTWKRGDISIHGILLFAVFDEAFSETELPGVVILEDLMVEKNPGAGNVGKTTLEFLEFCQERRKSRRLQAVNAPEK